MINIGLQKFLNRNVDNFTSDYGLYLRRTYLPKISKSIKDYVLKYQDDQKRLDRVNKLGRLFSPNHHVLVGEYPKLDDNTPYIFVSIHRFVNDTVANLATIDRNAYILFGTTDQLIHNPITYGAWLNGFMYVDRLDKKSRSLVIPKEKRIIESGNSVLNFPEGGFNNTENLLVQRPFNGAYLLAKETGAKIVPIAPLEREDLNTVYIKVGEPIDALSFIDTDESKAIDNFEICLTDSFATMIYELIEKYDIHLKRSELGNNPRLNFMKERMHEYERVGWTSDVNWDEELTRRLPNWEKERNQIIDDLKKVKYNLENIKIMSSILGDIDREEQYSFKNYMKENFKK